MYKIKLILGILLMSLGWIILNSKCLADDAGDPYSSKADTNIGAWYDETWQASAFYRLKQSSTSTEFYYEYTTTPTTSSNPTFVRDGVGETKNTSTVSSHNHTYSTPGASLPQDIVITEWHATGHVHFSSGM
jgi:hypothetical protein